MNRIRSRIGGGLLALGLSLLVGAGGAQAYMVTESTDFSDTVNFADPSLGALDVGSNTVSGGMSGLCEDQGNIVCGSDLQDTFLVDVGIGTQIDSIVLTSLTLSGPEGFFVDFRFENQGGTINITDGVPPGGFSTPNVIDPPIGPGVPIGPGTYAFSLTIDPNVFEEGAYEYTYEVAFTVSSTGTTIEMSEPLTLGLFAVGLVALGAVRRKPARA